jgi:hypothetical protein
MNLGTRGEIEARSCRHRRHSSLLVQREDARMMIDCGTDWLSRHHGVAPTFGTHSSLIQIKKSPED